MAEWEAAPPASPHAGPALPAQRLPSSAPSTPGPPGTLQERSQRGSTPSTPVRLSEPHRESAKTQVGTLILQSGRHPFGEGSQRQAHGDGALEGWARGCLLAAGAVATMTAGHPRPASEAELEFWLCSHKLHFRALACETALLPGSATPPRAARSGSRSTAQV